MSMWQRWDSPPIGKTNHFGSKAEHVKNAILDGLIPNTFEAADAHMRLKASEMGLAAK